MNLPETDRSEKWHAGACYCGLWEKSPKTLEDEGIPRGFCGLCQVCKKPGHTMHFPGAAAFTGSWCKKHYFRTRLLHPLGSIGMFIWGSLVLGVILMLGILDG